MGEPRFNRNKRYVNKKGQKFGKGIWEGYGRVIFPGWGDFDRDNRTITQYNSDGTKTVFSWEDWQDKQTKDHELRVLQNDRKYGIPYIPSKKITISIDSNSPTRKNAGAVLSENMLDSIASNAKKAGLSFSTAIGMAAQESTLGHAPSRTTGKSMLPWLYSLNGTASKNRSAASKISYKDTQSPSLLISNWKVIAENPYYDYQYDGQGNSLSISKDKDYYKTDFNSSVRKGNNYKLEDVSPLYKGFKSYKENPKGYNHGDSDYPNKVKAQSQELVNYSPEIKSYMKKHNLHDKGGYLNKTWGSLSLADKAEMIKVAVANGIITLPEIRQAYNKFAEGGGLNDGDDLTKLGGFTSPTLNVELKQQENPGEVVAQKPQISAPSGNIVNVNNRNTDTETAFRNYLDSPIIMTRLAKQYGSDQVDTKLQEMKDRFNKTSIIEGNFGSSYNNKGNIYIDTNATTPWMSNKFAKPIIISHELAHTMYPSNDFNVGKSTTYLNKITPTEKGAKNIYRTEDVGKTTDSYEDSTLGHDKQDYEKAAMVYEVREHMRKLGLWDYTSGQELTPEMWQKYNSIYKRNRLGNYTNDENAVDSLNNLALNTSPVMEEVNYAANGGTLKKSGYSPSSLIKKKISDWEGSSMKTNRSFEAETKDFNRVIPEEIRSKLSSQQLDALYSYGYNVGMGNLKERVVPTLTAYIEGKASREDVQRSMWAKRDNKLRGLTDRRNAEREMFGGNYRTKFTGTGGLGIHLDPSEYTIPQSFFDNFNAGISLPQMQMPNGIDADPETLYKTPSIDETLFSKPEVTQEEPVYNPQQERIEGLKRMTTVMGLLGQSTPFTGLADTGTPGLLSYINQIYNS